MTVEEKEAALAAVQARGSRASAADLRTYLRQVRELRLRESELVAEYGSLLLSKHGSAVPLEERLLVAEQTAIAAMDCNSLDLAFALTNDIRRRFPESHRALRLASMYFEARGKTDRVQEAQAKVLEVNADSTTILKRQVGSEKTLGNLQGAIELLRKYVDLYQTDKDAWEELADLYVQASMYAQAGHCYEELLLHQPHSIPLHVQYADVLYTLGGQQGHNYSLAQSHYAAAVKLSKGRSARALYGLCACAAQLSAVKGSGGKSHEELASLAAAQLQKQYQLHNPQMAGLVKQLLAAQGLATDRKLLQQ